MSIGDFLNKAKDLAGEHPDQARDMINKAEAMIDERTGGKFSDQIHQGGDLVEGQLGVDEKTQQPEQPSDTQPSDTQPSQTQPADMQPTDTQPQSTDSQTDTAPTTPTADDAPTDAGTTPSDPTGQAGQADQTSTEDPGGLDGLQPQ